MSSIKVKRSKLHLIWEIPVGIIVTIIEIAIVAVVGLNATKSLIYSDYYGIKEDLGVIPGLNGSATPQGISVDENTDTYFFSSYRTNGEPSAIFTQKDGEST
ncbi:MAG: hypothetical protein LUD22_01635, partial [Coprobacillus sp.]|nr:hypothetical protein [Coprobacillus sp.]